MPTQGNVTQRLRTYGQHDTGPPLDYQLKDRAGDPIDLAPSEVFFAESVWFEMGHTSFDHYWNPTQAVITNGVCVIDPNNLGSELGWVRYPWQEGDLKANGTYDYIFRIKWSDGTVQSVRSLSFDHIRVQVGPYAQFKELP